MIEIQIIIVEPFMLRHMVSEDVIDMTFKAFVLKLVMISGINKESIRSS